MALTTVTESRGEITAAWPRGLRLWTIKTHPYLKHQSRTQCVLSRYFDQDGWRLIVYREIESPELDPVRILSGKPAPVERVLDFLFYAFIRSDLTYEEARELSTTLEPFGYAFEAEAEPSYWAPDFDRSLDVRETLKLLNTRYLEVKQGVRNKRVISSVNLPQVGTRSRLT